MSLFKNQKDPIKILEMNIGKVISLDGVKMVKTLLKG
jgi:hypothetical protein